MMFLLLGPFGDKVVSNLFKVNGDGGLSRVFISAAVENLMGGG